MRFFNLDLHVGVIGDIKNIFHSLGHDVTNWSISGHASIFGGQMAHVEIVNASTWQSISREMCDAFYRRYNSELSAYDGFIVTHTPCFAMLYERWRKPIICVASTRYEQPFTNDRNAWEIFNTFLRDKIDEGMLIPIANNKYDAAYAEYFTQRQWKVISSICDYTNAPYTGTRGESICFSKFHKLPSIHGMVMKDRVFKESLRSKITRRLGLEAGRHVYSWKDRSSFRSAVWIPYNASIMSIFEMYTSGIPMLFPSRSFLAELYKSHGHEGVLSELSFNQVKAMPPGSVIACDAKDPNNYVNHQVMMQWIEKADYYDLDNMAGLGYFSSFDELEFLLQSLDMDEMHRTIVAHNSVRKQRAYLAWEAVLADVALRV